MNTPILLTRSATLVNLLALALALSACGESTTAPGPVTPPAEPAKVGPYLAALPAWSVFSPPLADTDAPIGASTEESRSIAGAPHMCTTTPYSITRTPDRIVTLNPDVEILWVGSLLQGKGHLGGIGQLAELPIRQRAPLALSIDLLTQNNSRTVQDPTVATVTSAIGQLIEAAQNQGHRAGSNIFYTKEVAHSFVQAALSMSLSASYMGASIKAALSSNISEETRTVTAYFVQRMFNVSMVLPQTPDDVFSDALTESLLQAQIDQGRIGPDNLPVYVSSVAYGRILMFSFTSSATLTDINATIEAIYNNGEFGGSLSAHLQSVLENAKIQVVTVGGDAGSALSLIRGNNLGAYFEQDAPLTTARPISYTVRNLADNSIASVSETTSYNLQQCIPAALPLTGATYTIRFTKATVMDLPNIDGVGEGLLENRDIELQWTLNVETIPDGVVKVSEYAPTFLNPFVGKYRVGETYVFPANSATNRAIHWDGRDYIRLWGQIRDYDFNSAADVLPFSREFRYPSKPISAGEGYVDATDSAGNKVRVFFTVQKTGDLDD